jgi:lipopolysaccharide/colanic/teichoic acid biosynthesis glycosyltransferase
VIKRICDVLLVLLAAPLVAPLVLIVAVAVKVDSSGPVFFRQERVGRFGRPFRIVKFRSMNVDHGTGGLKITARGDSRITRVGRWLRWSKLDEVPQLWNVLVGDMSLVGPRPEVPEYVRLYTPHQRQVVLSVRPGLTDLAAIEFRDEEALLAAAPCPEREYAEVILPRKLALYERYVEERGLGRDLQILLRTLVRIARG